MRKYKTKNLPKAKKPQKKLLKYRADKLTNSELLAILLRTGTKGKSINELILFGINSIIESKEKCTFERLIKECFTLFPEIFSFSKYPQWPDSRKLDRPLRALRKRKLITGDPKTYFSLTKLGKKIALETAKTFRQRKLFK